ncbi:MAG: tetratricopeptide repeat protein [Proteobacteria bacterium]|nr:tetratricopeptide repeat protein [Pseudomonadota bacterium]
MSFFEELKRRNVFKVTVIYVIVGWVLLQVADVLFSALNLPGWTVTLVAGLLIIGFPVALIFAWAFELTPEGVRREGTAVPAAEVEESAEREVVEESAAYASALAVSVADAKSIAVLPFVNMSDDESNEYFSDGISEELLNLLAKIPKLRVAAQTSSFSLKGKEMQILEVGEILKVDHVLEGSVRKAGNQVRITVQLIKVDDGYHMWSETYDRTLDNIFAIQDEIAVAVVEQLKITLLGQVPTVKKTDPTAYALYLRARQLARQSNAKAWEQSIVLYQQALAVAPGYASAWAGLADVYSRQTNKALRSFDEGYALALDAAEKALEVDPENADAHASLGSIALSSNSDIAMSARHFEQALALGADNPDILLEAAILARSLGRQDVAIALLEFVVARDPVNSISHYRLGSTYLWAGRLDAAIASIRIALSLSPGRIVAQWAIGVALLLKGEPKAALEAMQQESDKGWRTAGLVLAYHALGQVAESDAALVEIIESLEHEAAYNIAYLFAFRGESDRAFEWLDKAVQYNDPGLQDIPVQPLFSNVHSDPRWLPFLESIGKSPRQLAAIGFKVTLPE